MVSKVANMDSTMLAIPKDSQHTSKSIFVSPQKRMFTFFPAVLPHPKILEAATAPQQSSMVKVNSTANNTKATVKTRTTLLNIREAT